MKAKLVSHDKRGCLSLKEGEYGKGQFHWHAIPPRHRMVSFPKTIITDDSPDNFTTSTPVVPGWKIEGAEWVAVEKKE
jgi:hypothetical protein